ncbi:MAG: hypothetical protein IJ259_08245 [Oscillospiraceae bacterium]|nr:hypothetical protein [Oscillospiraceae bacterium]
MNKTRTMVALLLMVFAALIGFYVGSWLQAGMQGAILFSMIAGIACIVYTIDNRDR